MQWWIPAGLDTSKLRFFELTDPFRDPEITRIEDLYVSIRFFFMFTEFSGPIVFKICLSELQIYILMFNKFEIKKLQNDQLIMNRRLATQTTKGL